MKPDSPTTRPPASGTLDFSILCDVLLDEAHEGVWVVDAAGGTAFANARAGEILGYTVDELQRLPLASLLGDAEQARLFTGSTEHHASEPRGLRVRRKDGSLLDSPCRVRALVDRDGCHSGTLVLLGEPVPLGAAAAAPRTRGPAVSEHDLRSRLPSQ